MEANETKGNKMNVQNYIIPAVALGIAGKNMDDATWMATIDITIRSLRKHYANFDGLRFEAAANLARTLDAEDAAKILTH